MQLFSFLLDIKQQPAFHALPSPADPLVQDCLHAHDFRCPVDQDGHVKAVGVLQLRGTEQFRHQRIRIHAALVVDGNLKPLQVDLVADVGYLIDPACAYAGNHLLDDYFRRRRVRDLIDFDDPLLCVHAVLRAEPYRSPPGTVYLIHLRVV